MSYLLIDNKEYHLPKDLPLKKWMEVVQCLSPEQMLHKCLDIPEDKASRINDDLQVLVGSFLSPVINPKAKVNLKIGRHKLIDLDKMSLGTFIDLDVYRTAGLHKSIDKMANILYGEGQYTIRQVWGAVNMYLEWNTAIYRSYPQLFGTESEPDTESAKMTVTAQMAAKRWLDVVMVIADGDALKVDAVTALPLKQAFNWLAWNKEQKQKEKRIMDEHKARNKTLR